MSPFCTNAHWHLQIFLKNQDFWLTITTGFMQVVQREGLAQKIARVLSVPLLEPLCFLCLGLEHCLQISPALHEEKAPQTCYSGMNCE